MRVTFSQGKFYEFDRRRTIHTISHGYVSEGVVQGEVVPQEGDFVDWTTVSDRGGCNAALNELGLANKNGLLTTRRS